MEVIEISPFKQRFSDAPWFEKLKSTPILLLGVGGIGSWVAFCLSRIGCDYTIYDMDVVEAHNLGGQMYSMEHIGMSKTQAISAVASRFSGQENKVDTFGRYTEKDMSNEIVIAAFDNMLARKLAFTNWLELLNESDNKEDFLFIDGRLIAEDYQVYTVTSDPQRIEAYKATLFDDSEVAEVMCTLKSTTHCSMGIAHDMISILTNFISNRAYGVDVREVPYNVVKSIPLMTYEVILDGSQKES